MIELTDQAIDVAKLIAAVGSPEAGAVVSFVGTTRRITDGRESVALNYEAYEAMALAKLQELTDQAAKRWPIVRSAVVHRLGQVPLGEASVAIAVSTPHRAEAFAAARWLIDTIKEVVPIWKQEIGTDGTRHWVHPGSTHVETEAEQQP